MTDNTTIDPRESSPGRKIKFKTKIEAERERAAKLGIEYTVPEIENSNDDRVEVEPRDTDETRESPEQIQDGTTAGRDDAAEEINNIVDNAAIKSDEGNAPQEDQRNANEPYRGIVDSADNENNDLANAIGKGEGSVERKREDGSEDGKKGRQFNRISLERSRSRSPRKKSRSPSPVIVSEKVLDENATAEQGKNDHPLEENTGEGKNETGRNTEDETGAKPQEITRGEAEMKEDETTAVENDAGDPKNVNAVDAAADKKASEEEAKAEKGKAGRSGNSSDDGKTMEKMETGAAGVSRSGTSAARGSDKSGKSHGSGGMVDHETTEATRASQGGSKNASTSRGNSKPGGATVADGMDGSKTKSTENKTAKGEDSGGGKAPSNNADGAHKPQRSKLRVKPGRVMHVSGCSSEYTVRSAHERKIYAYKIGSKIAGILCSLKEGVRFKAAPPSRHAQCSRNRRSQDISTNTGRP